MQQQHYRWAIISDYHFTYICRTPKCKGTLKSNGHAKNRWSAPNPDGVSSQSLMVCVELQKSVCSHSSPMVWHTKIQFYRPLIYNFKHLTLYKMDKNCSRLGSFVSLSLFLHFFKMCPLTIQTVSLPLPSCWFWNASMTIPLTSSWHDVTDASILSPLDFSIHIGTKPEDFWVDYQILACPSDFITGVRDHRILESYIYIYILYLYITVQKSNQGHYDVIDTVYTMLQTLSSYFYSQMYLLHFKTLIYIYVDTIEKYVIEWSAKKSNPHA